MLPTFSVMIAYCMITRRCSEGFMHGHNVINFKAIWVFGAVFKCRYIFICRFGQRISGSHPSCGPSMSSCLFILLWFPKPNLTQRMFSLNTMHNTTILNVWVIGTIYWLVTLDRRCLIYQKTYDRNTLPYKAVSFIGMWKQSHEKHRNRESDKHLLSICPTPCFLMIVPLLFYHNQNQFAEQALKN